MHVSGGRAWRCGERRRAYIVEEAEKVGDGLSFRVCEDIVVVDLGATCLLSVTARATTAVGGGCVVDGVLPQHEKILRHKSAMI